MLALALYEQDICECGIHESLKDPSSNFYTFETRTCPVCRASAQFGRIQDAKDEAARKQAGDDAPPSAALPSDGRHTFVRPMTPFEVESERDRRSGDGAAQ